MAQQDQMPMTYADDEISITELLRGMWKTRAAVISAALIAVGIATTYLAIQHLNDLRQDSMVSAIELTGIIDGSYPGGTAFSPSDLTSSEVLADLKQRVDLDSDLPLNEALTVEYGHPALRALRVERDTALQQLSESDAPAEEVVAARDAYQEQIDGLKRSALKLRLNFDSIDVSPETAKLILETLPQSWQAIYADRFQIYLPSDISRLGKLGVPGDFGTQEALLAADQYLRRALSTLQTIEDDRRVSMVTSPNGSTASELVSQLGGFRQLFFDPFLASRVSDVDSNLGRLFLRDLLAEKKELELMLEETSRTIQTVTTMRSNGTALPRDTTATQSSDGQTTLSLGDSGLDSVINLAQQSSMQDYLKELFEQRFSVTNQIASLNTRIEKFTDGASLEMSSAAGAIELIERRFDVFRSEASALTDAAFSRIRTQSGRLYASLSEPSVPSHLPKPSRAGMIIALSAVLGGLVGLFGGLLRNTLRQDTTPE